MVQIYDQLVSDSENKDTLQLFCKILINFVTSTVVEYYYFGRQKICKIKMEPFLKQ